MLWGRAWSVKFDGAAHGSSLQRVFMMIQDRHVSIDGARRYRNTSRSGLTSACCIFSTSRSLANSPGTTLRGEGRVHYWLVRQVGETSYGVRGIDGYFLPFGTESLISEKELISNYAPEVDVFETKMLPSVKEHGFHLENDQDLPSSALRNPLCIDAANVLGLFDIGVKYIQSRKTPRGRTLINELVRLETGYPGKDQFLFNSLGIKLRKLGFLEGAVICYRKALQYTLVDDHLHYNLARAYYEQGQWWDCMGSLGDCFELNPALPLARDLVVLIMALADNAGLRAKYDKPPVPDGVARRAGLLSEAVFTQEPDMAELVRKKSRESSMQDDSDSLWLPGRNAVGM